MMTTMTMMMMVAASLSMNPMKMCMFMITASLMMMIHMNSYTGKTWTPYLLLLLFTGGIILMFMILSSTMPNEKMKSSKKFMVAMLTSTAMIYCTPEMMSLLKFNVETSQSQQMKMMFNNTNMALICTIMLIYFAMFMSMTKKNKTSMRNT